MLRCLAQIPLGQCMVRSSSPEALPYEVREFCLRCMEKRTCPLAEKLHATAALSPVLSSRSEIFCGRSCLAMRGYGR